MLRLPERVQVVEVAPRDGLQSLGTWIETDAKVAMIDRLSAAGFPVIEVTGFVHPGFIPALKDAEAVCARIARRPGTVYRALVPNVRGAERALGCGLDELLGLITVGETYLRKNQNMTTDEAVAQAAACFRLADAAGVGFVMAVGVALWCTYEGAIPEARVLALVARLRDAGIRRFYVAGSAGLEDPRQVGRVFARLGDAHPDCTFGYHVHDMAGMASANVLAALDAGAAFVEGAVCGIGGGVAMGTRAAIGNAPTEDLVAWLDACGVATGLDPRAVQAAARDVAGILGVEPRSRAAAGLTRWDALDQTGAAPTAARDTKHAL